MPDLSFDPEHFLIEKAFTNPVHFWNKHKEDIQENIIAITDLNLLTFEDCQEVPLPLPLDSSIHGTYWGNYRL